MNDRFGKRFLRRWRWAAAISFSSVLLPLSALAQAPTVLFSDDFDRDTAASWDVFDGSDDDVPDYSAEFNYDYSKDGIPPIVAGGTTRGVKLTVNKLDDSPAGAAVNVYPKGQDFTGNYALQFDMWLSAAGGVFGEGASGTTEFALFGLNHLGTQANWQSPADRTNATDGVFFAVSSDGRSARDFRSYVGRTEGPPTELLDEAAGFLDRDEDGLREVDLVDDPTDPTDDKLAELFPAPPFETPGLPAKQWVRVEISQRGSAITWKINGSVIATRPNESTFTSGNVMLGLMDIAISIANPRDKNFVIYDNVKVERLADVPQEPPKNLAIVRLPSGDLQLTFAATGLASQYRVQSKADLAAAWADDSAAIQDAGGGQFTVAVSKDSGPVRFFRIRSVTQ
ncbi:MAG: hypothetical protein HYY24_21265 [Verrucomicrobia bacterium]|nr:hypothetical protein [Verrucomicrobiota bacterium]